MKAALKNPFDKTTISLIYANVNQEDILLKEELEELLDLYEGRLKIFYVLNNPPANWKGGVGFVTKEQIKEHMPLPTSNSKILMCGMSTLPADLPAIYSVISRSSSHDQSHEVSSLRCQSDS
jgi:cytochrome-b5 reductase